jgi:flagellar basal-body rod protein FlgC
MRGVGRLGSALQGLQDRVRPMFRSLGISASGLSAQRQRIDAIAQNIANAETTRTAEGGAYKRRIVQMEEQGWMPDPAALAAGDIWPTGQPAGELAIPPFETEGGVRVAGVAEDTTEGPLVYDPGHPDADTNGYVRMPNVELTQEIVEMMEARRYYEANATAFQAIKSMLQRATQI